MYPATIPLVIALATLGGGGLTAYTTLTGDVSENHTLILNNEQNDLERLDNLKDDLKELKENDKETQRLLRKILEAQ